MKRYIYACLHVIGFINASSTTNSIDAMLPPIPAAVINNMINKSLIEVSHTHPQALSSSIGETFLTVYMLGGIHTLFHMPPVVLQARTYIQTILADEHLMRLYAGAKKLKDENKPEFERAVAWAKFDTAYRMLQKKLVEADIPGLTLLATPSETIEYNKEVALDHAGKICFSAAQLSIALSMQEQFNIDPITFYLMFKQWIPTELKAQSGSLLLSWLWPKG